MSSGADPHSSHLVARGPVDCFSSRASTKRRWRPFFTTTPHWLRAISGGNRGAAPTMSDAFNPNDMVLRFRERAEAVRKRGLPPVEGPERQMFMDAAKLDFQDYAMLGDAVATLEDGILRLEIDLRPQS